MTRLTLLLVLVVCLASCGAINYTYFVLDNPNHVLRAKDSKDDLDISVCDSDPNNFGKCVVMFTEEFFKARKELLELRKALDTCQRGEHP